MDDFIEEPPFIASGTIKVTLKEAGPLEPLPDTEDDPDPATSEDDEGWRSVDDLRAAR